MKKIGCAVAVASLISLAGCGGGGSGVGASSAPAVTELEGVWIASTDNHPTGGSCGLNATGQYGERVTLTFSGNSFTYKYEQCLIVSGNTGAYSIPESHTGTFVIGGISTTAADPANQLRALDLISAPPVYTSYNLTGNKLTVAIAYQTYDGTTPAKRAFQTGSYYDTVTRKLITAPVFTKQ